MKITDFFYPFFLLVKLLVLKSILSDVNMTYFRFLSLCLHGMLVPLLLPSTYVYLYNFLWITYN